MAPTIGILNADEVRPELEKIYGDYPAMFTRFINAVDPSIKTVTYNVLKGQYPQDIDEVDAYLLTGSKFSVYENEDWIKTLGAFIVDLHQRKKKLAAVCFGHQMVAHFLGGQTCKSDKGWGVGVKNCTLYEDVEGVGKTGDTVNFLATHQDQVHQIANGAKVLAGSDFCPNVITAIDKHILTIQWHPEFVKGYADALMDVRYDIIGGETVAAAKASLAMDLDADKFAHWLVDFYRN